MGATMKDIARVTGLGLATISSYLNGGNVREKTEEEILLSKSIENWKAGKTEEGAGQLEEYFEKMAVKLAAIHKGRD